MVGDERVKDRDDLAACAGDRGRWHDENKIIASNVPDEPFLAATSFHDIVQDLGENADDAVAIVIAVPVVEFLEVVEIRVAHGERLAGGDASRDLRLDLIGAGEPRRGV